MISPQGRNLVFILSAPRSGSTLVSAILGNHHQTFSPPEPWLLLSLNALYSPDAVVLAHPECSPEVVAAADYSGSTTGMIRYVENMESGRYLLLTECSMGDNIAAKNPHREMLRLCSVRCPHMNEITLEQTRDALVKNRYVIEVDAATSARARKALDRMISIG